MESGNVCVISRRQAEIAAREATQKLGKTVTVEDLRNVRRLRIEDDLIQRPLLTLDDDTQ